MTGAGIIAFRPSLLPGPPGTWLPVVVQQYANTTLKMLQSYRNGQANESYGYPKMHKNIIVI